MSSFANSPLLLSWNTRNQFFDSKEQLLISGAFIYSLWVFYFPDWLFHVMYWNNHDFVSILILYTPNEWKWKFRSLCTDYLVIYSVKKKQSSAFCSFGVRDFFIQTTLLSDTMHWFKNWYQVIKWKQFWCPTVWTRR